MTRVLAIVVLLVAASLIVLAFTRSNRGSEAALAQPSSPAVTEPDSDAGASDRGSEVAAVSEEAVSEEADRPDIPNEGPNMGLSDLDGWLQSDVTSLDELQGKVVVVQFWTFSCSNCQATLPNLQQLYAQHGAGEGDFEIVGVHAPEFQYEEDPANITAAAADEGVTWPIALDTNRRNFHSWQPGRSGYWPRTYVLDRQGNIRFDHIGEGAYQELNDTVAALLADPTL
ncbi:MAG: redoxin domain-containing protein [Euzebya sp.]